MQTEKRLEQKRVAARRYYWNNHEKVLTSQRRRWEEQKEKRRAECRIWASLNKDYRRNYNLKSKYGITLEEWNQLLESQNHQCAICETTNPGGHGKWCTDHIHGTKIVRGILCHKCNISMHDGDTPELLRKRADYLEKNR